jgi:transcriptional regulator with XRE-family HTH domain
MMSTPDRVFAALLKLTGLRQLEAAESLGVSRSTLAGWLSGYSPMPDEMILRLHRLLSDRLSHAAGGVSATSREPTQAKRSESL